VSAARRVSVRLSAADWTEGRSEARLAERYPLSKEGAWLKRYFYSGEGEGEHSTSRAGRIPATLLGTRRVRDRSL